MDTCDCVYTCTDMYRCPKCVHVYCWDTPSSPWPGGADTDTCTCLTGNVVCCYKIQEWGHTHIYTDHGGAPALCWCSRAWRSRRPPPSGFLTWSSWGCRLSRDYWGIVLQNMFMVKLISIKYFVNSWKYWHLKPLLRYHPLQLHRILLRTLQSEDVNYKVVLLSMLLLY